MNYSFMSLATLSRILALKERREKMARRTFAKDGKDLCVWKWRQKREKARDSCFSQDLRNGQQEGMQRSDLPWQWQWGWWGGSGSEVGGEEVRLRRGSRCMGHHQLSLSPSCLPPPLEGEKRQPGIRGIGWGEKATSLRFWEHDIHVFLNVWKLYLF